MVAETTYRLSLPMWLTPLPCARASWKEFWAGSTRFWNGLLGHWGTKMARLILSLDGQVLAEYNMNKERYTVGRLPDNDVRVDNPAVSGHHSLIINILNDSFL